MRFIEEIIYLSRTNSLAFTRRLQSLLKQNAIICVTGDVSLGQRLIPLEFFGRTRFFPTGMVSLAKISGASILPMFCVREKDGKTRLIIEPAIPTGAVAGRDRDLERSVAEYARLLESYIRTHPEKYRNWHHVHDYPEYRRQLSSTG